MWHASVQHLFCKLHLKMHLLHWCRRRTTTTTRTMNASTTTQYNHTNTNRYTVLAYVKPPNLLSLYSLTSLIMSCMQHGSWFCLLYSWTLLRLFACKVNCCFPFLAELIVMLFLLLFSVGGDYKIITNQPTTQLHLCWFFLQIVCPKLKRLKRRQQRHRHLRTTSSLWLWL